MPIEPDAVGTDVAWQVDLDDEVDNSQEVRIARFVPTGDDEVMAATDIGVQFAAEVSANPAHIEYNDPIRPSVSVPIWSGLRGNSA